MLPPVAALRATAQCPLVLRGLMVEVEACALWAVRVCGVLCLVSMKYARC